MTKGIVSVIVPSYNVESTIVGCLDSVYAQTYCQIEVIAVNDGSTDSTLKVLRQYQRSHSSLVVIDQYNQGLSAARNAGIAAATGDYLFFLDSDDYIGVEEIELLLAAMGEDVDMVVGGMTYVGDDGGVLRTVCDSAQRLDERGFWDCVYSNRNNSSVEYVVSCGKLFRASLFEAVRFEIGKIHEDEFILHRLVGLCKSIAVVPACQYYYVQNPASITHRPSPRSTLDVVEAFMDRNRYFFDSGFFDFFWLSLCQAKASLVMSSGVISSDVDIQRWRDLKRRWNRAFSSGFRYFDLRNRNCFSCAAYRYLPVAFNKRNGSVV